MAVFLAAAIGIGLGLTPLLFFGSRSATAAWLADRPTYGEFSPSLLVVAENADAAVAAHVWNFTDRPIRVLGVRSTCGCMQPGEIPETLPPNRQTTIPFVLSATQPGEYEFATQVDLSDDTERSRTLPLSLHVRIE